MLRVECKDIRYIVCASMLMFATDVTVVGQSTNDVVSMMNTRGEMTYDQLRALGPERSYLEKLSFDPTSAKYYAEVSSELKLNETETNIFRRHGFVCIDHDQRYSFPAMYYAIYTRDLPVLVTTDSVLHALHRSYEEVLADIELYCLAPVLDKLLAACHDRLAELRGNELLGSLEESLQDVDLYLTVARNLLTQEGRRGRRRDYVQRASNQLAVTSCYSQDHKVKELLSLINSFELQYPGRSSPTTVYGGQRYIDFSQFRPRGHYAQDDRLEPYFKCMMWISRADCGWHLADRDLPPPNQVNADRELRASALLTQLLNDTNGLSTLDEIGQLLDVMVGPDDDLTPAEFMTALKKSGGGTLEQLAKADGLAEVRDILLDEELGTQQVRSQVVMSDPLNPIRANPSPVFQLIGQRLTLDAFILSHVVFDSIVVKDASSPTGHRKMRRMMPSGLDVMAALGNDTSVALLEPEIRTWRYATNLSVLRDVVANRTSDDWQAGLHDIWLDCLRTLDDDLTQYPGTPEVMRTSAWQRKQLQTQLASWSELRHDMLLYGKQSYTGGPSCEYPTGYIEPYPELYERLAYFADEAARALGNLDVPPTGKPQRGYPTRESIVGFFKKSRTVYSKLKSLALKELAAQPFDADDQLWLKKTIDRRVSMSGPPRYDGWYSDLYYRHGWELKKWCPTVVDVHTDPESATVLQTAVGDAHFCAVAIDSEGDRMVYVGPVYSYYEFERNASERLTDTKWQRMLTHGELPVRPAWFSAYHGSPEKRSQDGKTKQFIDR